MAIVGAMPCVPRPLIAPNRKKRLVYLEVGQLLLRKYPSESTARAPRADGDIDIRLPPVLDRLAPVMRFNARHR